jgi:hypothetical protein
MSETAVGSTGSGGSDRQKLYDEAGNMIGGTGAEQHVETLVRFSREQPLATALIALGVGYILGKMI